MENLKDRVKDLHLQFFYGEGEKSRDDKFVGQLKNAGYDVSCASTEGSSALVVGLYEVCGPTAIDGMVKQLTEA